MVQHAIQDSRSDHAITEDLAPGAEALIAGEDQRSLLVAARDELEEEVRTDPIDGQVADLIDNQQPRYGVVLELLLEPTLPQCAREDRDHVRRGGEEDAVASLDGLQPQSDGQMGFAHARGT